MSRLLEAQAYHRVGMMRVQTDPEPEGQVFPCGSRVHIAKDLGMPMSHFPADKDATVVYCYAHAFGGDDVENYCLNIDDIGEVSWYYAYQLTLI